MIITDTTPAPVKVSYCCFATVEKIQGNSNFIGQAKYTCNKCGKITELIIKGKK